MSKSPVLNTILEALPKKNIIIPLNLRSNSYDSFPPIKTPKLQSEKNEIITFPDLRGIPKYNKVVKKVNKKIYKITEKLENNIILPHKKSKKSIFKFFIIFLFSLILCSIIYTMLLNL